MSFPSFSSIKFQRATALWVALSVSGAVSAGDLLNYSFDSLDGTPSFQASGVTGSVFDRDPDHLIGYSTLVGNPLPAAQSAAWNTPSLSADSYYTFTITASSAISWNSVRFDLVGFQSDAGGDAPTQFAVRSSADNFSSSLLSGSVTGAFATELLGQPVTLASGNSLEYRIYAWGAGASGATVAVDNVAVSTAVVPEPSSAVVTGLALGAMAFLRRQVRRSL